MISHPTHSDAKYTPKPQPISLLTTQAQDSPQLVVDLLTTALHLALHFASYYHKLECMLDAFLLSLYVVWCWIDSAQYGLRF